MIESAVLAACLIVAQVPPPPPPPPPMPRREVDRSLPIKGTATIKGKVLTADGRPLRRAQVIATAPEMGDARSTTTGLEGEYVLDELPAGRFTITVTRSGYLQTRYGQTRYGEPAAPLQVDNGKTVDSIDFTLQRAGVISGRVVDENGEAAAGVQMWAMQPQFYRGARRLVPISTQGVMGRVVTDDAGNYRLLGLPPGEYVVTGRLRDSWMSDEKQPRILAYAPTYFPGTASEAEAQRVKVVAGQETGAVDFPLMAVPTASISGTVLRADGTPASSGSVSLTQEVSGPTMSSMSMIANGRIDSNGAFKLTDIAPGEYVVRATTSADAGSETATLRTSVVGTDVTGLVLAVDAGVLVSGRVVTDTGEPLPAPVGALTITTTQASSDPSAGVRSTAGEDDGVVNVAAGGTFARRSPTGAVILRVSGLPRGWALKQVAVDGRDLAGLPLDLRSGQPLAGVTVVVSRSLPAISGRVVGDDGAPASGVAIVFPAEPARWLEPAQSVKSGKTDQAGVFRFDAMRPGDYFAVAVDYVQQWQIYDPEFLSALRERATKVRIASEPVSVDLKVVR
jgi:hypothetical protein